MIHIKKCCLCYDLRLGAQIISITGISAGTFGLFLGYLIAHRTLSAGIFTLIFGLAVISINICLAYGTAKKNAKAILIWLISTVIVIVLEIISLIFTIVQVFLDEYRFFDEDLLLLLILLSLVLNVYFFICVYSFFEDVRLGKYRHEFNNIIVDATTLTAA